MMRVPTFPARLAIYLLLGCCLQLAIADDPSPTPAPLDAQPSTLNVETPHARRDLPLGPGCRLVVTHCYALSLNPETKLADWCAFIVTPAGWETDNRPDRRWHTVHGDEALEAEDYEGSGYHRGHLCPLGSFSASRHANETNRTENIVPMSPRLNTGLWLRLEERVRSLSRAGSVAVVCGPLFEGPTDRLPAADEPHEIPTHLWHWFEWTDASGQNRVVEAYIFPQSIPDGSKLSDYQVDPRELSQRTGLPFE